MSNFIDDFQDWIGETETPPVYFKYAAISLAAACLSMRVCVFKQSGNQMLPVYPNLYTLLLGPSGNGKSLAVSRALALLRRNPQHERIIHLYDGKTTAPAMYEMMATTKDRPWRSMIYVVNDELANDIGIGEYAGQFIKSLTRMYLGESFTDATVTRGVNEVRAPYCVNWMGCTTRDWLKDCLERGAVEGGFFARVIVVEAGYTGKLISPDSISIPPAWVALDLQVTAEVERLLLLQGEFKRSHDAYDFEMQWYKAQVRRTEGDPLAPTQRRDYDMLLKFAQIASAAESSNLVIERRHIEWAAEMVAETSKTIPGIADFISLPQRYHVYRKLQSEIIQRGSMRKSELARLGHDKGLMADEVGRLLGTWVEAGLCSVSKDADAVLTWTFTKQTS